MATEANRRANGVHRWTSASARLWLLLPTLICTVLLAWSVQVPAGTAAGSVIRNQASASYRDSQGIEHIATSNILETLVRQAAGVQLLSGQNKFTSPSGMVSFPHVLSNTGNGNDRFTLSAQNTGGDQFDFDSVELYADRDQNGVADDNVPLSQSPELATGESFHFIVHAQVPGSAVAGQSAAVDVSAQSQFDALQTQSNTDTATVTNAALIDVVKSISATQGAPGDGPILVTLSYSNDSASTATDVTLIDALPEGLSHVAGSARWSQTGSLVLTDDDGFDSQGSSPDTLRFCAYQSNCSGLAEADQDEDDSSINQVTAILDSVPGGAQGSLQFQVMVDDEAAAGELFNTAEFDYHDGVTATARVMTNSTGFEVQELVSVVANGSVASDVDGTAEPVTQATAYQGTDLQFENVIWNTGNGRDSFDVLLDVDNASFPSGSVHTLFQSDGMTPLVDSSGNGIPDTGPLDSGTSYRVIHRVSLPAAAVGDNAGAGYGISVEARSTIQPSATNSVTNRLDQILPGSVDLTNNAPAGASGALGQGAGPEGTPVLIETVNPSASTELTLYATNTGNIADSFALAVSTDPGFASSTLPEGWTVIFRIDGDTTPISSTPQLAPAGSVRIQAEVSVPTDQVATQQSLYFRVLSANTGSTDVLHDTVSVNNTAAILLEPDSQGQLEPGSSIVYTHRLQNTGNSAISNISLSTQSSLMSEGWSASIHADTDGNGGFNAGDALLDDIATLAAAETRTLFVKVNSPATAAFGARDTTVLTAFWNNGADSVQVRDVSTVAASDISIIKEQAPDLACDGIVDGPFTRQPFAVEPGNNCVQYRLTAINEGVETIFNARIADATPAFTVYQPPANCSVSGCTITEPAAGQTGEVRADLNSVAPGQHIEFLFTVIIE